VVEEVTPESTFPVNQGLRLHVVAEVDIRTVQELLGHTTIGVTVRYSHCHFCQFYAPALPR
jgi:site-specific recombinase XerC